jgi:hypothetical protein
MAKLLKHSWRLLFIIPFVCFLVGCKGIPPVTNSSDNPSNSNSSTNTNTGVDGSAFAIIEPKTKNEVDRNIITVKGVGAKLGDSITVEVLTNKWWLQNGQYNIKPDGSWTYSPCYLMGRSNFRLHHSIKATLMRGGSAIATSIVEDIKAPEPQE